MRKIIFIIAATSIVISIFIIWKLTEDISQEKLKKHRPELPKKDLPETRNSVNDTGSDLRDDDWHSRKDLAKFNEIISKAAKELNRSVCRHKIDLLWQMNNQEDHDALLSDLKDIAQNQCSQLQKQHTIALIETDLNNANATTFLKDYKDLTENVRGLPYLTLFRTAIEKLESHHNDILRKNFFLAFKDHVQNASNFLEIAIAVSIMNTLLEKKLLSQKSAEEVREVNKDFENKKRSLMRRHKQQASKYQGIELTTPHAEIFETLGVEGIKNFFQEDLKHEFKIVENFRERVLKILLNESTIEPK